MKCPFCKQHPVSVAIIQPDGENVLELGLCEFCAKQMMLFEGACPSIQKLAAQAGSGVAVPPKPRAEARPSAATPAPAPVLNVPKTLAEKLQGFQKTGRLSGPDDYQAMEAQLTQLFQKIQGGAKHTGKVPHPPVGDSHQKDRVAALEAELAAAVKAENYEKAARLRDQIREARAADAHGTQGPQQA